MAFYNLVVLSVMCFERFDVILISPCKYKDAELHRVVFRDDGCREKLISQHNRKLSA